MWAKLFQFITTQNNFAELLKAFASLLWPILGFVVVFQFRTQLRGFIDRLQKGKFFGQEFELAKSLDQLSEQTSEVANQIAVPQQQPSGISENLPPGGDEDILQLAGQSPRAALITLAGRIEREARSLLAATGHLEGRTNLSFMDALKELSAGLPQHLPSAIKLFWLVRNRIVHGHDAGSEDVLRAIDSGMVILKALRAIPHEINIVHHPGVTIYSDVECKNELHGVKGVILQTISPGGASKSFRIFPTTKTHFKPGMKVAWEWSFDHVWRNAYYIDPENKGKKLAWNSSAEFIGRNMNEV